MEDLPERTHRLLHDRRVAGCRYCHPPEVKRPHVSGVPLELRQRLSPREVYELAREVERRAVSPAMLCLMLLSAPEGFYQADRALDGLARRGEG